CVYRNQVFTEQQCGEAVRGRLSSGTSLAVTRSAGLSAVPLEPKDHRQAGFTVVQRSTGQTRQIVHTTTDRTDGRLPCTWRYFSKSCVHNFGNRQAPRGRVGVTVVSPTRNDRKPGAKETACGVVSLRRYCPDQVPGGRRSASELSRPLSLSSRLPVSPVLRSVQLPRSPRRRYSRCMAPMTGA